MTTSWGFFDVLLLWCFLGLTVWIAGRFVYYFNVETGTTWQRCLAAAGDSATYFAAKAGIFMASLLGLAADSAQFLSDPTLKAQVEGFIHTYVTDPRVVSLSGIAMLVLVLWARSRTKNSE